MDFPAGGAAAVVSGIAAAYQNKIANSIKAMGAVVKMDTGDFLTILNKIDQPLVIVAHGGYFKSYYRYLVGYKGLVFFTKSKNPLELPMKTETIAAGKIWIPNQ